MSALAKPFNEIYDGGEKLRRREGYLTRNVLNGFLRRASEVPPSNDNRGVNPNVVAIEHVEDAIDAQHACIGQLMHRRNADPKNAALKQELDDAFAELERLEERRATLLRPYLAVKVPSFSVTEQLLIEEAERARSKYEGEDSSEDNSAVENTHSAGT